MFPLKAQDSGIVGTMIPPYIIIGQDKNLSSISGRCWGSYIKCITMGSVCKSYFADNSPLGIN